MVGKVSVVMVSYHTGEVLEYAIARVLKQEHLHELIVVDNGNPPEVLARLRALAGGKFTLISGHGNIGFAAACNAGAKAAGGEYMLLLNPDCLLEPGAFAPLIAALESHLQAMLAGANIINADGTAQRAARRELLTPKTAISESLGLHRFFNCKRLNVHSGKMPARPAPVPAISGACMLMRASDYHALGGMDEGYFLHVEDMDLCMRVRQAGGEILFVPQVKIIHLLSTSDAPGAFIERCKARGFVRYFGKFFKSAALVSVATAGIWVRYYLKRLRALLPARSNARHRKASRQLLLLERYARKGMPCGDWAGKTVLLTGATSQIGLIALGRLLGAGAKVVAISRKPLLYNHENLTWVAADIAAPPEMGVNPASIPQLFACEGYIAIHCAGLWLLPGLLPALAQAGVKRIVAFGSTSMFGKETSANAYEQETVGKLTEAEAMIADICKTKGMAYTILRPTLVYGVGLDGNVSRIAGGIRKLRFCPFYPPANGLRQPVHADDLALAALAAVESPSAINKAYNVSGGETITYRAMVERIFHALHITPRFLPLPFLPLALDVYGRLRHKSHVNGQMAKRMNEDLVFPHDEAARDFGYSPRAFAPEGI